MNRYHPNPLSVPCPDCGREPGDPCIDLRRPATPRTVLPHPGRHTAAQEAETTSLENRPTMTPEPNRPDRTLEP